MQINFPKADDASQSNPRFKPPPTFETLEVLYIDESSVPGPAPKDELERIRTMVQGKPFNLTVLKLEDVFKPSPSATTVSLGSTQLSTISTSIAPSSASSFDSLQQFLSPALHSPTSLSSLLHSLRRRLILAYAKEHLFELILTGESATRIAVQTIAGMAEGRGWSLGEETGNEWEVDVGVEDERVRVVRPLGLMLQSELEWFARLRGLQWIEEEKRVGGEGREESKKGMSIDALTRGKTHSAPL